jgi:hypothetical protein
MNYYTCKTCGYEGKDTEFLEMICPACCTNIETNEHVDYAIPSVFHIPDKPIVSVDPSSGIGKVATWLTKDGRQIPIEKMATQHIKNTLKMLRNQGYIGMSTLQFYLNCTPPTAEGALDAFDQEFNKVVEAPTTPYIDLFEAELKKRGEKV